MSETNNQNSPSTNGTAPSQAYAYVTTPNQAYTYVTAPNQAYTYVTAPNQASSNIPTWNTPTPTFLQNAPSPLPTYNASPSPQVGTAPTAAPQWRVAGVVEPNTDPASPFYQAFLKSYPRALGITLIVSAILEIILGIAHIYTLHATTLISGISFWGPLFHISAGSLSIAAQPKPNICLVKGSLSLSIFGSISSFIAIVLNSVDLAYATCYDLYPDYGYGDHYYQECMSMLGSTHSVLSLLLMINLLLFCVSISLSIFGCRSLSHVPPTSPQVLFIQNNVAVPMNPSTVPATFPGLAQPFAPATDPPPPYVLQVKAVPTS